ncbi:type II toxin-antitoxin system VapC family toxin [Mesorhizobium retamae]|uniref:Ribonuclease VapC n=1 Tax=Mesorhizobium retamae TaxID=2912854 RepID=A0ABS9QBN7_9HYPH|nr:type II toxin-antitoxin system VapC family toxin [Mesorhizobium sp. IRAMC:0171]MCG7504834.1 type II toxin-antitoxin system VapC family toxin [Mesorhizobium sp. IRAMC:0171]
MIVIDTNVVSEAMKPVVDTQVAAWLRSQPIDGIYITAITQAELLYGLALMPDGQRKEVLARAIQIFLAERLRNPILPFADQDALPYAKISARRRKLGRPVKELDGQIAAIAVSHGFAVATRNVADFEHCGIAVINPWEAASA